MTALKKSIRKPCRRIPEPTSKNLKSWMQSRNRESRKRLQNSGYLSRAKNKQEKAQVRQLPLLCLKHRPAEPFGMVLFSENGAVLVLSGAVCP